MKKKLVVFHPAIAPYRIDFFNSLNEEFDATFYFEFENTLEQNFNQKLLIDRLNFVPHYLKKGLWGIKNLRLDVWRVLQRLNPEIVFISEYNLLGLLVCLYKCLCNSKLEIVTICDDNLIMAQSAGRVKRFTRYVMLHLLSMVILADQKAKNWYEANLSYKSRYLYFPIVQSDDVFRERLEQSLPIANELLQKYDLSGKKVILYVGRLAEVKNIPLLLDVFVRLEKEFSGIVLFIVGDGPLREQLEKSIKESLEHKIIFFVGQKEGVELMAYYNLGSIFVLPSLYEPFGTVVNEALLAGCYVLCSSKAGATCLIQDGENGSCFDPHDSDDLLMKLKKAVLKTTPLQSFCVVKSNGMRMEYNHFFSVVSSMFMA